MTKYIVAVHSRNLPVQFTVFDSMEKARKCFEIWGGFDVLIFDWKTDELSFEEACTRHLENVVL